MAYLRERSSFAQPPSVSAPTAAGTPGLARPPDPGSSFTRRRSRLWRLGWAEASLRPRAARRCQARREAAVTRLAALGRNRPFQPHRAAEAALTTQQRDRAAVLRPGALWGSAWQGSLTTSPHCCSSEPCFVPFPAGGGREAEPRGGEPWERFLSRDGCCACSLSPPPQQRGERGTASSQSQPFGSGRGVFSVNSPQHRL